MGRIVAKSYTAYEVEFEQMADYIHLYNGNASLLTESLEVIQKISAVILAGIENPAAETAKNQS